MTLFIRYPALGPLSMFMEGKSGKYTQHELFPDKTEAEVIFIFGIFPISKDLIRFMNDHSDIEVVFLVDTLSELLFFIDKKMDKKFDNKRIHVIWKDEGKEDKDWIEDIVFKYPYENICFLKNHLSKERFDFYKDLFLRKIVLQISVHKELLNYPKLCKNLISNIPKMAKAFDIGLWKDQFKDIPAVIAGAGPSLQYEKQNLTLIQDKAVIFAGGSTITVLDEMGIDPHFAVALDPNKEEYDRIRYSHCYTTPLIYANRVQKDIFRFFSSQIGYIRTDTGGLFETYVEDRLGIKNHDMFKNLSEEALSVTVISLMIAIHLGCNPIYFMGVDLSRDDDEHYSGNVLSTWENKLKKDEYQEIKWEMERNEIDRVARSFPERIFYDATSKGLPFLEIKTQKVEEKNFPNDLNLAGKIEDLMMNTKFNINSEDINNIMNDMKNSLNDLCHLIRDYISNKIGDYLFIHELEKNISWKVFFEGMTYVLQTPVIKKITGDKKSLSKEKRLNHIYSIILKEANDLSSLF